jgi:hypothetical protein
LASPAWSLQSCTNNGEELPEFRGLPTTCRPTRDLDPGATFSNNDHLVVSGLLRTLIETVRNESVMRR